MQHKYINTPFGIICIKGSELGIRSLQILDKKEKDTKETHHLEAAALQLQEYFDRKRQSFDLKLDWSGCSDFYKLVWAELLKIPYGKTVAYSDIAEILENPKAVRAVGAANARNPIGIIVPCHRVIGKNGSLTGFASGLEMKMKLLRLENPVRFAIQGSLF